MSYVFEHCQIIESIPEGLFDHNPKVTSFANAFYKNYLLTSIPENLFANCPLVTTFGNDDGGCFSETAITAIPANLFASNPLVTSFLDCFRDCDLLTSIPAGLFRNNPLVTNFENTFGSYTAAVGGCIALTAIPAGLFDNCLAVTNFNTCFRRALGLDGNAPALWTRTNPAPTGLDCFLGCTGLDNYASIPVAWV